MRKEGKRMTTWRGGRENTCEQVSATHSGGKHKTKVAEEVDAEATADVDDQVGRVVVVPIGQSRGGQDGVHG